MNKSEQSTWQSFASLNWYDSFIEFLFRFVAKTSEPLLALGLVISAVDFLSKGALLSNNQPLTMAWAWTQAIAIEASSGVVFVYALQSWRSKDPVKAWLYLVLSILLALTGGAMLLIQLLATTIGTSETTLPTSVFYILAAMRVLVSVSYVYMCRAKHIRFTDLEEVKQPAPSETLSTETVQLILSKLAKLDQLEQVLAEQKVTVIPEGETVLALPETAGVSPETESETGSDESGLQAQIASILEDDPTMSTREIAAIVKRPHTTVYRYVKQVKQQSVSPETAESERP